MFPWDALMYVTSINILYPFALMDAEVFYDYFSPFPTLYEPYLDLYDY